MQDPTGGFTQVATTSRRVAQQVLTIAGNRLALVTVEVQEERNRLLSAFFLALAIAGCALLAGMTLTTAIVVAGWAWSPLGVLVILTAGYGLAATVMIWLLARRLHRWQPFAASLDQLHKDRACIADLLA